MSGNNWCEICKEVCTNHPTICTICGHHLRIRPNPSNALGAETHSHNIAIPRAADSQWMQHFETALNRHNVNGSQRVDPLSLFSDSFLAVDRDNHGIWQTPPPEALNTNNIPSTSKPTSVECIKRITRIKVEQHSAILHQVTVTLLLPPELTSTGEGDAHNNLHPNIRRKQYIFDAIMAEFPPFPPYEVNGRLIYCGTGKRGPTPNKQHLHTPLIQKIAYMERGDGVTFVQKALVAQNIGCSAVICGNNVPVWPYVMKDAALEATKSGLSIPMVMVKRSDGEKIRKLMVQDPSEKNPQDATSIRVTISAERISSDDCVVCREPFTVGDIVMTLPFCSHSFHEDCAMAWLTRHNTCPFCRRELPTDDPEYEAERRRQQRTHAGSGPEPSSMESPWDNLFG